MHACRTCAAEDGELELSNAPRLALDAHWRVEHAHPCAIEGWLVLVLRRHAAALHELTEAEQRSFGLWVPALCKALRAATGCAKEYLIQFAEAPGHHHVHVHVIARAQEWPETYTGPAVLTALNVPIEDAIPAPVTTALMQKIAASLNRPLAADQ